MKKINFIPLLFLLFFASSSNLIPSSNNYYFFLNSKTKETEKSFEHQSDLIIYYSKTSGNPKITTNWTTSRDGTGSSPTDFNTPAHYIIQNAHSMTVVQSSPWQLNSAGNILEVEDGGTFTTKGLFRMVSGNLFKVNNGGIFSEEYSSTVFSGEEYFEPNSNVIFKTPQNTNLANKFTLPFGNLEFNFTGSQNYNLFVGDLYLCQGNLKINVDPYFAFALNSTASLRIDGDLILNDDTELCIQYSGEVYLSIGGNFLQNKGWFSGNGKNNVLMKGVNKTITQNGTNMKVNWTIDNGADVKLNTNFNTHSLTVNGLLYSGDKTIKVDSILTSNNPGISEMIILDDGVNRGTLKLFIEKNGIYNIPIGDANNYLKYTPVNVNFKNGIYTNAYLDFKLFNLKDSGNNSTDNYLNRYWEISQTGITNPEYDILLNYSDDDVVGCDSLIYCGKYSDGLWVQLEKADANNNLLAGNNLNSFSKFTGGGEGILPIKLSALNSTVAGRNIKLIWVTESEINNSGFDVERKLSAENSQWKKITFINGNGTKNTPTNYSYTDFNLQSGKYEYRLKQIDNNGNYEYFALNGAIEVGVPSKFDLSQNYPNPFNPITKINFDLAKDTKVDIRIFDMLGREVKTLVNENHKAGYYTVDFNAGNLTSGVYFYSMLTGEYYAVKRMVVVK